MATGIKEILTESGLKIKARENVSSEGCLELLLEGSIQDEVEKIRSRKDVAVCPDNSFPGYGVKSRDMNPSFKPVYQGDINYKLLRRIWYGLNYVELEGKQGVPHEILSAMNTSEILSLYRGFTKLIERRSLPTDKGNISLDALKEMSAEDVVSKIVGYGCKHQAMIDMQKKGHIKLVVKDHNLLPDDYVFDIEIRSLKGNVPLAVHREREVLIKPSDKYLSPQLCGIYQPNNISWHIS